MTPSLGEGEPVGGKTGKKTKKGEGGKGGKRRVVRPGKDGEGKGKDGKGVFDRVVPALLRGLEGVPRGVEP